MLQLLPTTPRLRRFAREPVRRPRRGSKWSVVHCGSVLVALTFILLLIVEWMWSSSVQVHRNIPPIHRVQSARRAPPKRTYRQWEPCDSQQDARIVEWCHDAANTFRFYNPSPSLPRFICHDRALPPNSTVQIKGNCSTTSTVRLFSEHAPVALHFNPHSTPRESFPGCNVPCWHDGGPRGNNDIRYVDSVDGTAWTFIFSMEGPKYYDELKVRPHKWKENQFWATTSYQSEIPLPYYSKAEYNIWHDNFVPFETGIKAAVFLARNCNSMNRREQIVKDLIASSFRVDSLSACLRNTAPPPEVGTDLSNKVHVMKHYLFYLAFENQCVDDYITEKLWGPYEAGTIPVYFGAPNVKDHVPNHSLIHVDDFKSTQDLAEYLEKVANDRELYESYHAWRREPPPPHFRAHYDMTETHSTCRMCRWAYARMHGLGWNHTSQSLRPLLEVGSREVCLSPRNNASPSSNGLVQHPFVESWKQVNGQEAVVTPLSMSSELSDGKLSGVDECPEPLHDGNRVVEIDQGKWRRTLYNNDGFVEFKIEVGTEEMQGLHQEAPLRLLLHTPLKEPITFRKVREGVWHFQNRISRYTILVASLDNDVVVKQGSEVSAVIDIIISAPMRLRILVEDIDTFHQGGDQLETYFGTLAADDFFSPVEVSVLVPKDGV